MKKACPSFICGYNNEALSARVTSDRKKLAKKFGINNVKTMTFDGSAHDSHQHQVFIDTVDNTFFEEFIPFLVKKYGLTKNLEEVIRVCTMSPVMYAKSTFSYGG